MKIRQEVGRRLAITLFSLARLTGRLDDLAWSVLDWAEPVNAGLIHEPIGPQGATPAVGSERLASPGRPQGQWAEPSGRAKGDGRPSDGARVGTAKGAVGIIGSPIVQVSDFDGIDLTQPGGPPTFICGHCLYDFVSLEGSKVTCPECREIGHTDVWTALRGVCLACDEKRWSR